MKKLEHYGIRDNVHRWIRSFLTDKTQQVLVEGATSDSIPVINGVQQGTVLGPQLFLLFINYLLDSVQSNTQLFADDCIFYRRIKNQRQCDILQDYICKLASWEKKWRMPFHPDKCSTIRVSRSRNPVVREYSLKGHVLTSEDSTRYLGVKMQTNMAWNKHMDQTIKKGNSMIGFLRRHLKASNESPKTATYLSLSSDPYWGTVAQSGTPTPKTTSTSLKWFSIERLGMLQTDHNASSVTSILEHLEWESLESRLVKCQFTMLFKIQTDHNASSVTSILEHLEWESLESRLVKCQFTMLFKIINDLVDIPPDHYLTIVSTRTRSHHSHKFRHVPASSDYFKNNFFPRTIVLWNSLPASLADAPSLVSFKRELSTMSF